MFFRELVEEPSQQFALEDRSLFAVLDLENVYGGLKLAFEKERVVARFRQGVGAVDEGVYRPFRLSAASRCR